MIGMDLLNFLIILVISIIVSGILHFVLKFYIIALPIPLANRISSSQSGRHRYDVQRLKERR